MSSHSMNTLLIEQDAGVRRITLNRPEVRNAMSLAMVGDLQQALAEAEAAPGVRVLVLQGSGGHFCAGGDLQDMARARMAPAQAGVDAIAEVNAAFGRLCLAYARTRLPVITVLEGTVMGGGFGLACVSDVSLALHTALFRLPETTLGVIPAQIAPFLVERIGYAEAKRLAVTGGRIDAQEALLLRLVHEVHADAAALDVALQAVITRVLACAPGAIGVTKSLLARARFEAPDTLIDEAAQRFSEAVQGPEGQEGTAAFMQKRAPAWVPQAR